MEQNYNLQQKENLTFRYLYGFGIFFVLLSHCDGGGMEFLSNWFHFGAFHLAIFVFGSGYFFKEEKAKTPFKTLWKNTRKLLIPLWGWSLAYGLLILLLQKYGINYGIKVNLASIILYPIWSQNLFAFNMGSWFLFPFFMVITIYVFLKFLFDFIGKSKLTDLILQVLFFAAGILGVVIANKGYASPTLLPVFRTLYFMPFYAAGMWYKKYESGLHNTTSRWIVLALCLLVALSLNTYFGRSVYVIPSSCDYPFGVFASYVAAFVGIIFWLTIADILASANTEMKLLKCLGNSSFDIMFHQFFGFFVLNLFYFMLQKVGMISDFDLESFRTNVWYMYCPKGLQEYLFLYVIMGVLISLLIKFCRKKLNQEWNYIIKDRDKKDGDKKETINEGNK